MLTHPPKRCTGTGVPFPTWHQAPGQDHLSAQQVCGNRFKGWINGFKAPMMGDKHMQLFTPSLIIALC